MTIETRNASLDEDYCADHAGFIPGDYVMLAVNDNGSGMAPEILAVKVRKALDMKQE